MKKKIIIALVSASVVVGVVVFVLFYSNNREPEDIFNTVVITEEEGNRILAQIDQWAIDRQKRVNANMEEHSIVYNPDIMTDDLNAFHSTVTFHLAYPTGEPGALNSCITQLAQINGDSIADYWIIAEIDQSSEEFPFYTIESNHGTYRCYYWDKAGWIEEYEQTE